MVEPAGGRPIGVIETAEVPLAENECAVAGISQGGWNRLFFQGEAVFGGWNDDADLQAVAHWVAAGHQGGARWRANGLNVKLVQHGSGGCQLIEVRRFDLFATGEADVVVAEIIGEDEHDVWLSRFGKAAFAKADEHQREKCEHSEEAMCFHIRAGAFEWRVLRSA